MKKIVVFGGTGGVGKKLISFLEQKYQVTTLGSKDVDVTSFKKLKNFFAENEFPDLVKMIRSQLTI